MTPSSNDGLGKDTYETKYNNDKEYNYDNKENNNKSNANHNLRH